MKKRGENEDIMSSRGASYDGVALGLGKKITWIIQCNMDFKVISRISEVLAA